MEMSFGFPVSFSCLSAFMYIGSERMCLWPIALEVGAWDALIEEAGKANTLKSNCLAVHLGQLQLTLKLLVANLAKTK